MEVLGHTWSYMVILRLHIVSGILPHLRCVALSQVEFYDEDEGETMRGRPGMVFKNFWDPDLRSRNWLLQNPIVDHLSKSFFCCFGG